MDKLQMKQVKHRNSTSKVLGFCLALMLAFSTSIFAQGDPAAGKSLFNSNCAACHKLDKDMTGPMLRNVEARLSEEQGLDKAWLYAWIRNSSGLIKSGDAYANEVYNKWDKVAMTAFPQFSDADIDNILAYTAEVKVDPPAPVAPIGGGQVSAGSSVSTDIVLGLLALVLVVLVSMLFLVTKTLNNLANQNGVEVVKKNGVPLWKRFVKNQFLVIVSVIFFLLFAAYQMFGFFMQVGVDQGYKPVQPIHYSHRIHAGENQIDCKYCHSSARVSKHSGIPSLNVCMNCHKNISEVAESTGNDEYSKEFYDNEIQKLYKAVGWDGKKYTGETEPVKWVRIHNLPDFAYFNHSQHVTVAGVACQKCHGPVEEMEILEQHAPLTMGWCINCHRETNVKTEGNEYYDKIHAELKKKYGVDQLTVAQMGGLECGKCHY
jgi:mono/diheme cytochrome c family protein